MRKSLRDAELIWQDNEWIVYYPQNWDAACTLGKGTSWCTADSRTAKHYVYYTYDVGDSDGLFDIKNLGSQVFSMGGIKEFLEDCYNDAFYDEINLIIKDLDYKDAINKIIEFISNRYSDDCVVEWNEGGVWFINPHEKLTYSECNAPLYIFINKKQPSIKYQLWCGDMNSDGWWDVETWSFADKYDKMHDFSDMAWEDKSLADFALEVLDITPQEIFVTPPPWDDEYEGD